MKPSSGSGKHTTIIKDMYLDIENTPVKNKLPFFLEVCYYGEVGCKGDNEQPEEREYFEINSIRSFNIVEFSNENNSVRVSFDPFAEWCDVVTEDTVLAIADKVLKELKEEDNNV